MPFRSNGGRAPVEAALQERDLARLDSVMRASARAPLVDQIAARATFFQAVVLAGATYQLDAIGRRLTVAGQPTSLSDASLGLVFQAGDALSATIDEISHMSGVDSVLKKAMCRDGWGGLLPRTQRRPLSAETPPTVPSVAEAPPAATGSRPSACDAFL